MKKITFLIIFYTSITFVNSSNLSSDKREIDVFSSKIIKHSKVELINPRPKIKLSDDLLKKTDWEWHDEFYHKNNRSYFTVRFSDYSKIEIVNTSYGFGEGAMEFNGRYKLINDSTITGYYFLYSNYEFMNDSSYKPVKTEFIASLKYIQDAIHNYVILKFNDMKTTLISKYHNVLGDTPMKFEKFDIITINFKSGKTRSNVKIYEYPTIKSQALQYSPDDSPGIPYSTCPKGTSLNIIARTVKKDVVNNFTSYWYYVEFGETSIPRYGWIFSNYIKVDENN